MNTWRKVGCCLVAAVCGVSAAFGEVAIQSEGDDGFEVTVSGIQDNTYRIVCVAVGDKDYGGNIADWPYRSSGVLVAADGTVTVPYPAEWGAENAWARAFAYDRLTVADPTATSDYLTDGLVAHWDAVGATSTSEWVDLVNGYVITLTDATVGNNVVAFSKTATSLGVLDATTSAQLLETENVTMETVFSKSDGNGYMLTGTANSKIILAYWVGTLVTPGTSGDKRTIYALPGALSTCSVAYNGNISTYRSTDRVHMNGGPATSAGATYWYAGDTQLKLGNSAAGTGYKLNVEFGAIRIYNRSLAGWEMKYNADIDRVRFRGGENPTQPVEGSTVVWMHGIGPVAIVTTEGRNCTVEGGGLLRVGEEVTLTATPHASSHFLRWEGDLPEGIDPTSPTMTFTLEDSMSVCAVCSRSLTVDAINRDSDDKPVSAVVSIGVADVLDTLFCAYGETDGGDDLTAWDYVENVRMVLPTETSIVVPFPSGWGEAGGPKFLRYFFRQGVEARSVAKDGLAAIWDGIDNVATGVHAEETSQWIDLVAGRPIDLYNATIGEKTVGFAGTTASYGTLSTDDSAATFNAPGSVTWECRSVVGGNKEEGLEIYGKSGRIFAPWQTGFYSAMSGNSMRFDCGGVFNSYRNVAVIYSDGVAVNVFIDAAVPDTAKMGPTWGSVGLPTGVGTVLSGYSGYPVACTFQTLRVYTNALSSANASFNHVIDEARYKDGVTLGEVESCTETLTPQSDVRGTFTIQSNVPHGIVTGAGEYEQGETVTLSVTMEEGYTFHRWLGDLPDGVDAHSPEISFTADAHRELVGFILMPWEAETDSTGKLVAISNSVWHFAAKVSDGEDGVTLSSSVVSSVGQTEALDKTVDLSTLQRDTGYRLTRLGASVFNGKSRLGSVRLVCEDLLAIGDSAFANSGVTRILPEEVFPNLETVGAFAFQGARRFVAPKVKSIGVQAFNGSALTNFYPTTLAFPLPWKLFYGQKNLRGDFVIDSPSTTIPEMVFGACSSVSSVTFNSPVVSVDAWAFYECSPRAKFYWNVPAPTTLGMCAFGACPPAGTADAPTKPVPQLICATSKIADGFAAFADGETNITARVNFVPKEKIDPKFLTKQYRGDASLNRIRGWLVSDGRGGGSGVHRIWVVGPKQGGMLLVR